MFNIGDTIEIINFLSSKKEKFFVSRIKTNDANTAIVEYGILKKIKTNSKHMSRGFKKSWIYLSTTVRASNCVGTTRMILTEKTFKW